MHFSKEAKDNDVTVDMRVMVSNVIRRPELLQNSKIATLSNIPHLSGRRPIINIYKAILTCQIDFLQNMVDKW